MLQRIAAILSDDLRKGRSKEMGFLIRDATYTAPLWCIGPCSSKMERAYPLLPLACLVWMMPTPNIHMSNTDHRWWSKRDYPLRVVHTKKNKEYEANTQHNENINVWLLYFTISLKSRHDEIICEFITLYNHDKLSS